VKNAVKDQFYGDRSGTLTDPFGLMWTIATHKEDVSVSDMQKRMEKMMAAGQNA
jgi:PhnB protein